MRKISLFKVFIEFITVNVYGNVYTIRFFEDLSLIDSISKKGSNNNFQIFLLSKIKNQNWILSILHLFLGKLFIKQKFN